MKIKLLTIAAIFICNSMTVYSQDTIHKQKLTFKQVIKRGEFYISWGYNRDIYSASDIHFHDSQTLNYDFTWYDALAHDQPDADHLFNFKDPVPFTVPQYNFNVGFMFNDKHDLGIEVSWEHLKYVVADPQIIHMVGQVNGVPINEFKSIGNPDYHFEHTNGNNYLMLNLVKRFQLYQTKSEFYKIGLLFKPGAGILIPKTDTHVMGYHNDGPFRYSGWTGGLETCLRQEFFKYIHVSASLKTNFVDYTDIKLYETGRATQTFTSLQFILTAGFILPGKCLGKK
jgi:hypothetical protein